MFALPLMMVGNSGGGGTIPTPLMDVPFQANLNDVSGNGFNPTDMGNSIVGDFGFIKQGGYCLKMSPGQFGADTAQYLYPGTTLTTHTFSCWAKIPYAFNTIQYSVVYESYDAGGLSFDSYGHAYILSAGGTGSNVIANSGDWVHICATFNVVSLICNIYINGVLDGSAASIAPGSSYRIGIQLGGDKTDIYCARLRIWNSELTPTQVLAEYNRA